MKKEEQNRRVEEMQKKYEVIGSYLNERSCRIWAGMESISLGKGGKGVVQKATGISYPTIRKGIKEIEEQKREGVILKGIRKGGGGRKKLTDTKEGLLEAIGNILDPSTMGDPEKPLLWTSKSTYKIADELQAKGYSITQRSVYSLVSQMGYSLQLNKKTKEGGDHPDRDAQFEFINKKVKDFQARKQPVISVDTKKKENIGNFKNNGVEYHLKGKPLEVNVYDFLDKEKGKASPYGVYDLDKNKGWVSVGISSDTAEFAVNSIRNWWNNMGKETYPDAEEIYINADGGGSNGSRVRLWKVELQKFAHETGLIIHVSHFPPGTSKWNKIEHRMFSFISKNWRGKPLIDTATIVNLIGNTTTTTGLKIRAELDKNTYEKGIKVSDDELAQVYLQKDEFHGDWNYSIS